MYILRVLVVLLYMAPASAVWTCKEGGKVVFRSEPCEATEETLDRVEWHSKRVVIPSRAYAPSQPPQSAMPASKRPVGHGCSVNSQCGTRERCQVEGGAAHGVCVPK